jgi:hypothetical protein
MILFAFSKATAPSTNAGPDKEKLPTVSTLGASSAYSAIIARTIKTLQQHSGWGDVVPLVWKHGVHVLEWPLHLQTWTGHMLTEQL